MGAYEYDYFDPSATPAQPAGLGITEATPGELNPAYYFEHAGGALKDGDFAPGGQVIATEVGHIQAATSGREDDQMAPSVGINPQSPRRPDGNDSTAMWRTYAEEMGTDHQSAHTMSRAEIQKKYPA